MFTLFENMSISICYKLFDFLLKTVKVDKTIDLFLYRYKYLISLSNLFIL